MKVAVVGGGVAGITAAHILQRTCELTLFEKNAYVGGHTNTVEIERGPDAGTPVDTGFIVFNDRTYPLFTRLLGQLGVPWRESNMSFSFHCPASGFFYAGNDLGGLFAQRRNIFSLSFLSMLAGVVRFSRRSREEIRAGRVPPVTLRQYLDRGRYPRRTIEDYVLPMASAIWSSPAGEAGDFPAEAFLRFFDNHGLLSFKNRPRWRTIPGGSRRYVEAFLKGFRGRVLKARAVTAIRRGGEGVHVKTADGAESLFDRVVVAAHADEALAMLADPDEDEQRLLGKWRYHTNRTLLHTDRALLPPRRRAWASWNYTRETEDGGGKPVSVTYYMNRLQGLRTEEDFCVTLNACRPPREDSVHGEMAYFHPHYTFESIGTQKDLAALNGRRGTYFCGSYFGYGFHEDAVRSAVKVAEKFGLEL